MDGVLRSWAVPKGPSYDMNDKRLAVKVEDHPLEYGDFEGIIPAGNYGAGGVIVWDRGEWVPLEDWREGLEKGKLLFELRGYKLHGKWTLVKIKKSETRVAAHQGARLVGQAARATQFPEASVLSGLTVEEVKAGDRTGPTRCARARGHRAARRASIRDAVKVMLAEPATRHSRATAGSSSSSSTAIGSSRAKPNNEALLLTRNGNDYTAVFPEIARAVEGAPARRPASSMARSSCSIAQGKPSFARLQRRGRLSSPIEVKRAAVELPATFFAFDLLAFEDFDLRPLPLSERKALLLEVVPQARPRARARPHRARGRTRSSSR